MHASGCGFAFAGGVGVDSAGGRFRGLGIDVAVERWQAETGREAILDGDGRTFAQIRTERLGDVDTAPSEATDSDVDTDPARKRKSAA